MKRTIIRPKIFILISHEYFVAGLPLLWFGVSDLYKQKQCNIYATQINERTQVGGVRFRILNCSWQDTVRQRREYAFNWNHKQRYTDTITSPGAEAGPLAPNKLTFKYRETPILVYFSSAYSARWCAMLSCMRICMGAWVTASMVVILDECISSA